MGTPSMIGFYNAEDGSVTATYCHYDGYLAYNGRMLLKHYNTPELAKAVANSGYLSSLETTIEASLEVAVNRDNPVTYNSVDTFMKCGYNYASAEYLYLFDGETWFFANGDRRNPVTFEEVEMNLETAN